MAQPTARGLHLTLALLLIGLLLAACSAPPAAPPAAEATTAPAAAAALRVAYASDLDPADIADQLGLRALNESGVEATTTMLNEDSAVVAALLRGDIDIGNMDLTAAIKAYQVGVPLQVLMPANMAVEFVLIGQPGIKTVEDLRGKRVAFHAPGSGTEILPRLLVRQSNSVSEEEVEWIVLPESPNRAAAMEADRIDVTALEFADVLTLREGGKPYELIASFHDVAPEAIATVWVTTNDFAAANEETLAKFVEAMGSGYDQAREDKALWMSTAGELLDVPEARLSETYDFYSQIAMFPDSPFFTADSWNRMNEFYISTGEFEDPAPLEFVNTLVRPAAGS
jgi:NitT/TauT family transport system substrate-binding protein